MNDGRSIKDAIEAAIAARGEAKDRGDDTVPPQQTSG